jgi:hypothetical protein
MIFFVGMHQPSDADKVPAAFISVNRLRGRRSGFPVRRWVMDCAGFVTLDLLGGYPEPVAAYAAQIKRFADNGRMLAAVSQDYMCEPFMLVKTGLSVAEHQRLTIERYDELVGLDCGGASIMPVLQGYAAADYVEHLRQYGTRLASRAWVGVGSVCKRNANPNAVETILLAIKSERPDLRLHGFGVKVTALGRQLVRDLLFSADSMAWSYAARYEGRDANDPGEAFAYGRRVATMPVQLALGRW